MTKCTPHPWYWTQQPDGVAHVQSAVINEDNYVCQVDTRDEQGEANARLITQAPAMLECCRHHLLDDAAQIIAEYLDEHGDNADFRYVVEELVTVAMQMREAIREVNG